MGDAVATLTLQEDSGNFSPNGIQWHGGGAPPFKMLAAHVDIAGDYTTNGIPIPDELDQLFGEIIDMVIKPKDGYFYDYDAANKKIKMFTPASAHTHAVALDTGTSAAGAAHTHTFSSKPPLVVSEAVTVTTNSGTLANIPLYIVAVHATAGSTTGAFNVIPAGETPVTKQAAVDLTTGVLTFLGSDAVTACLVTYIPKRAAGYLSAVTIDEAKIAASTGVNLAARAGAIQYVWDDTDGKLLTPEPVGETPTGNTNVAIDINNSGNTTITTKAPIDGHELKITYIPYTQLAPGTFIDDTDITLDTQVYSFANHDYNKTVVPGFGTQICGEVSGGANSLASWEGPSGTAANGVAVWNPAINKITTAQTSAMVTTAIPWFILDTEQLTPQGTNANESTHTHGPGTLADAASASGSASGAAGEVGNGTSLDIEDVFFIVLGR